MSDPNAIYVVQRRCKSGHWVCWKQFDRQKAARVEKRARLADFPDRFRIVKYERAGVVK
ncbi:MAG: hypothetical protein IID41_12205 [Planctomycetes bacterium]|nr:hypothetical protein [Planctomycetota bacterium]